MIRFMGNGRRIENVVRSLSSGFVVSICHVKSRLCCCITCHDTELVSVVRFMTQQGYSDVFVLSVSDWEVKV